MLLGIGPGKINSQAATVLSAQSPGTFANIVPSWIWPEKSSRKKMTEARLLSLIQYTILSHEVIVKTLKMLNNVIP